MKYFLGIQIINAIGAAAAQTSLPSQPSTLIYILAAIATGGGVTGLVSYLRLKRQGQAEKEEIITRAAEQAVSALQVSLHRLEDDLVKARAERDELEERFEEGAEKRQALEKRVAELNDRIEDLENSIIGFRTKEAFIKTVVSIYEAIFLVHIHTGQIQYANPAAHIFLDYTFDNLVNTRFDDLIATGLREKYQQIKKDFMRDSSSIYTNKSIKDLRFVTKLGQIEEAEIKFIPLDRGVCIITAKEIH